MSRNKSTQKVSFWNFLQNNKIEIPIIQRDYAQGRLGKEYLRRSFLSSIKEALDNNNKSQLKLDFVYGSSGNGKMLPLDGQQRLTTLWLLHWYIALRAGAGELTEDVCRVLSGFSYETRISSREFCDNLCVPQHFERFDGYDVVGFITTQTWFYSAWKQDPTIQSMLRMLSGTKINDKNGEDIIDGIEELFKDTTESQFKDYWKKLRSNDAPIVFYFLPLNEFKLTDDLYIKMNARGKQLTSFENFKADLIGYITRQSEEESFEEGQQKEWKELIHPKDGIPIKIDTEWTDIFWENKSKDNRIDEIYFAFINRFFLNELVCKKDGNNKYVFTAKELEEKNPVFSYLYGNKGDDASIEYVGFEKYKEIPLSFLKNLKNTLNGLCSINNLSDKLSSCYPTWIGQDFQFIPEYIDDSITTLERKGRIAFFAISKYIQKGSFDEVTFRQWMRVVWNIIENAGINSISNMIGAMRLIDEISNYSHAIYDFLFENGNDIHSSMAQEQIKEEIAKVRLMRAGTILEKDIKDAESHPLLKGCIRALFEDDNCNIVSFGQSLKERLDLLSILHNKTDEKDYTLVKQLVLLCDSSYKPERIQLKKNISNWKVLITDKLKDSFRKYYSTTRNNGAITINDWRSMISYTDLIENSRDDGKILGITDGDKIVLWATSGCNWNAYQNVVLDYTHYNPMLAQLVKEGSILCNQKVNGCDFFWGRDINFKYKDCFFRWLANPNERELDVYIMEDDWTNYKERLDSSKFKGTDDDLYYCFRVINYGNQDVFLKNLNSLIEQTTMNSNGN